jgi:hypothetical protein
MAPVPVPTRPKSWRPHYVSLNQGGEGACVGFGCAIEAMSDPVRVRPPGYDTAPRGGKTAVANAFARAWYHLAQDRDSTPGHNYTGTSVLAGAKVAKEWGYITGYRWPPIQPGLADLRAAVVNEGPVPIAIPWYREMYHTLPDGTVKLGGDLVGWHCICVDGWSPSWHGAETYRWLNSWGPGYGDHGFGYTTAANLFRLLSGDGNQRGEACIFMGRSYGPKQALAVAA